MTMQRTMSYVGYATLLTALAVGLYLAIPVMYKAWQHIDLRVEVKGLTTPTPTTTAPAPTPAAQTLPEKPAVSFTEAEIKRLVEVAAAQPQIPVPAGTVLPKDQVPGTWYATDAKPVTVARGAKAGVNLTPKPCVSGGREGSCVWKKVN